MIARMISSAALAVMLATGGACAQSAAPAASGAKAKPAAAKTLEGLIKGFECGDNCYLTIVDAAKRETTGLCVAKACDPWNEKTEIPRGLIGKRVRATLGVGVQVDGSGNVMGKMTSFKTIEFLK